MNRNEYAEFHAAFCSKMMEITAMKNADYSGGSDDPFNNFRQIENLIHTNEIDIIAVGFLTRMSDKFSRIGSFIAKGELQVKDESVGDTLLDLANYAALFAGYLAERKQITDAARRALDQAL